MKESPPADAAVDRVLLACGVAALGALLCGTLLLDRAVGGALPLGLHALIAAWIAAYAIAIPLTGRVRSMRQLHRLRLVNMTVGIAGTMGACYLLGGPAWIGPTLLFFAVLGAAFMQARAAALIFGAVVICAFAAVSIAETAGWIPSFDPFAGSGPSASDATVRYATIAFLSITMLAFYGIAGMIGFFVTLQRDLLKTTSRELEAKKDELEALNAGLEARVQAKTIELEERNRELAVMAEIGTIVNASLDLEHVYLGFMTAVRSLIPFDFAAIAVLSEDGASVRVLRVRPGVDGGLQGESIEEDASDSIHAGGRPRVVEDFDAIEGYPSRELVRALGIKSGTQVPIATKGRTLGAFNLASRTRAQFSERDAALMERLAEPLALAIENCRLYDGMREMAETDGLTRLPNRRAIARLIAHEIARGARSGEMCSVLVLDIDNFKVFNDTLGHQAGDDLLVSFSRMLQRACRESDVVARQAGDEFTILLPGSGPREATVVAQRIHDALSSGDLTYPGQDGVVVRSSIGIATYPVDGEEDEALLLMADRAMYAAKAAGGGQSRLASRLSEREANADTSRQLRFGMLETLANRIAARAQGAEGDQQAFAGATARAAWAIGERMALDDSEQQLLRVASLAHALGILPDDDPRATPQDFGLDAGLDEMYLKIGRVFVAGSPGLIEAVRVLAQHHRTSDATDEGGALRYAQILRVAERYAELTLGEGRSTPTAAMATLRNDASLDSELVQMLEEGLNLPAVWRAA